MRQVIVGTVAVGTVATLVSLTLSKRPSLQEGVPSRSDLLRLSTAPKRIEHVSGLSTSSVITSKSLKVEKSPFCLLRMLIPIKFLSVIMRLSQHRGNRKAVLGGEMIHR